MNNIVVSIIVPVYNSEKYVGKCIESLLNQTYKNIEIIIIDDGSTDNSKSIIKEYLKSDDRIIFKTQKNMGANIARYTGIKLAKGKFCLFIDSDDWIENNAVEKLVSFQKENDYDIIKFNGITEPSKELKNFYLNKGEKAKQITTQEAKRLLLTTNILNNLCFSMYRTEILKRIKSFKIKLSNCEDLLTNLEIYNNTNRIIFISNVFYHYRENQNSTTKSLNKEKIKKNLKDFLYVSNSIFNYAKKWHMDTEEINNMISFRILTMTKGSIFKLFKVDKITKEDFLAIVDNHLSQEVYDTIHQKTSLGQLKDTLKKESLIYNIKNYYNIINLYNKNSRLLWLNYYIYKIKK